MMKINNFQIWIPLLKLCLEDIPFSEFQSIVYILRVINDKEILYIGETSNLRQRMFRNFIGGVGGGTTERIHSYLFNEDTFQNIEVSWLESTNRKLDEAQLLEEHKLKYGRLPRWNKR